MAQDAGAALLSLAPPFLFLWAADPFFSSFVLLFACAVNAATLALDKYNIEKDIAAYIKKEFDKKYNPTWHCIVGRNFGSYVTHETKHFIYFYIGQVAILLFKSG